MSTALTALLAFASLAAPPQANALSRTYGEVTINCSYGSCSYYVSRSATRKLDKILRFNDTASVGTGTVCTALALSTVGTGGAVCAVVAGALFTGTSAVKVVVENAVEDHPPKGACFKVTRPHAGGFYYPSTNNGKYCKD